MSQVVRHIHIESVQFAYLSDRPSYPASHCVVLGIGAGLKFDEFKVVRSDPSRETAIVEHCGVDSKTANE